MDIFYYLELIRYSLNVISTPKTKIFFPKDSDGSLGVIEFSGLDFKPARFYWLTNIPEGLERGRHAHKQLKQAFVALAGSCQILLSDGNSKEIFNLCMESPLLNVNAGLWRELSNFSTDALIGVFASEPYDETDYIRDYDEYILWQMSRN